MNNLNKSKIIHTLIAFTPGLWACLVDLFFTVIGQPREYWQGNLLSAKEGNPLIKILMINGTSNIFFFVLIWIFTFLSIGYLLPNNLLRVFSLFILVAHTFGAAGWIANSFSFIIVLSYIFLNSSLFIYFDKLLSDKN
jgi:hypothetical protein